jgi:hypothetical protein
LSNRSYGGTKKSISPDKLRGKRVATAIPGRASLEVGLATAEAGLATADLANATVEASLVTVEEQTATRR